MQEHLFKDFESKGHNGFLGHVSITLIDKTDGKDLKKREINGWGHSKPMLHLQLILQTVSDQFHEEVYMLPVGLPVSYFLYWSRMNRIIYVLI